MEIIFTNHAKIRIQERNIKVSDIKSVVIGCDKMDRVFDDAIVAKKVFGDYAVEVVYKKSRNKIIIITAYYL